jgi:hypothetical protein
MAGGAFRNSTDLINKALANLGVLSPGQPIDAEDFNYVKAELDSLVRKLNALEIVNVPDIDNIPGSWFSDLADILAGECATKFGAISPEQYGLLVNRGLGMPPGAGIAALSLKQITRGRPTYEILQTDYI